MRFANQMFFKPFSETPFHEIKTAKEFFQTPFQKILSAFYFRICKELIFRMGKRCFSRFYDYVEIQMLLARFA